jgi:DNA segregation ATPase FtsK/SpoIIIE, S-DNA-T family
MVEIIERQRAVLRAFQEQVLDRLTEVLATASNSRDQQVELARNHKLQAKIQNDEMLGHVLASMNAAQEFLKEKGQSKIVDQFSIPPSDESKTSGTPAQELENSITASEVALGRVRSANYSPGCFAVILAGCAGFIAAGGAFQMSQDEGGSFVAGVFIGFAVLFLILNMNPPSGRYKALLKVVSEAQGWHKIRSKQISREHRRELARIEQAHQQALEKAANAFHEGILTFQPRFKQITDEAGRFTPEWGSNEWTNWVGLGPREAVARLGMLHIGKEDYRLPLPYLIHFPGTQSFLFELSGTANTSATRGVQSLLIRLAATIPPGKLRFTFIDPVGLGQNVAPLMQLADYDEALVTARAWTEPQHIEQRLADLTEHMENVIQKYLRNQFATIEEYNHQAGEVAEPYRVVVVFDFPTNFTETAARRLVSIAQNGPRCGVYAITLVDMQKPLPYGFSLSGLEQNAIIITDRDQMLTVDDPDFRSSYLVLDSPPDSAQTQRLLEQVGQAAKENSKVEVPFERVAPPPEEWWTGDSSGGLRVPLGPSGARKVQLLELGQGTAQHVLIAGRTGSGKSTLLHTLIVNLSLIYSPHEVELYLIDFKKGVEFKTYAQHYLPNARVIAIESEREYGLSVLQGLDSELKRRGDLFRAIGVDGMADYRRKSGQALPRILLLVDEFQEFFTEDDAVASQSGQILDRLVRQGRAFGVHVLLGSQTLAGAYSLARSTMDQMAVRIALQCSEADSRLILTDDNPAARLLSRPGEAIYNAANGTIEGNNRFQVAWLPDDRRDHYLAQVTTLAQARGYRPAQPQIIFEGDALARVEQNSLLHTALTTNGAAGPHSTIRAWLGEPIAIREPIAAAMRRQSGSNLLIVGQNESSALGIMTTTLISLAAQLPAGNVDGPIPITFLDFGAVDSPHAPFFEYLAGRMPNLVRFGRRRQLGEVINDLSAEMQRRIDADETAAPPRYLFIHGLHRARDLRQEESFGFSSYSSYGDEPAAPNPAQQFTTLVREGPEVGIHTIVWCDTNTNLNRTLDRRALREFAMRIVLQMSAEDSSNLIDTPAASKLGQYRAIFYNEDEGRIEKFRPYTLPSNEWLGEAVQALARR